MATAATNDNDASDGDSVLEAAFLKYQENGLRLPPVPRELIRELDEFSEWTWGSDPLNLQDLHGFLEESRAPGGPAEVAFGHVGHGVSSYCLCYRLKLNALAVFVRQAYGGAYDDDAAAVPLINDVAAQLESLIPAAEAAKKAGRYQAGHRLIVVLDELQESFWELAGSGLKPLASYSPIADAIDFLSRPVLLDPAPASEPSG
ncbi:MAG: hypothetical protein U0939_01045 [Pirellulales bacterium]